MNRNRRPSQRLRNLPHHHNAIQPLAWIGEEMERQ